MYPGFGYILHDTETRGRNEEDKITVRKRYFI